MTTKRKACLKAIASYLPESKLTNEDLARNYPDWAPEKILAKTGISVRGIASPDECASDLAVRAAENLFDGGTCARSDIDHLLLCTQSPDYPLPATACLLQERLGLSTRCGALDFSQGCSGFVYGLSLAKGLIESGSANNVLLITAETYSKFLDPDDRGTRTIFGDGAAATLIGAVEAERDLIGPFVFGTDGRGAKNLIVRIGGSRNPVSQAGLHGDEDHAAHYLYMNGPEIFNFTIRTIPKAFEELLERAGKCPDEVSYFVFHQASQFMLEHLRNKLRIPEEKFCVNLKGCGNTVSSTIPIAIQASMENGTIRPGDLMMLLGFGVGYSWAGAMLRTV